jgi:two-component system cell cycle sensor histidine kinase/response regulator CckA
MSMEKPKAPLTGLAPEQDVGGGPRNVLRVLLWQAGSETEIPYREELERAGWDVQLDSVKTREEFSVRVWSCNYDVVLAEPQPGTSCGVDAVEVLHKFRREIPVILVTGGIGEENVAEALRSGVTDYVAKDRLRRLPIAVRRILNEKLERVEKKRLSEERDRFFMLSGDLLGILNAKGCILQLNPAWQRTLGHEIEELVKHPLSHWVHPEDQARLASAMRSLADGATSLEFEIRCSSADGSYRWLQWRASSLPRQHLIYATARDVSEKKILEAQLLRSQRIESIGTLANGIAHDLNNVLTPILMAVEILQDVTTEPRAKKLLNTVQSSAQHGAAMVKQILAFSKGADGEKLPLQVHHLVNQMRDFAHDTFPKSIEIQTRIAPNLWMIKGDSTQLHQVLLNLCVNARDAMLTGGKLCIEVFNRELEEPYTRLHLDARCGPYVVISVTDTGSGIPHEIIEKIFEPFFTTKDSGRGTGLGLSTVLGIVKGHEGFLNVYSEPGKGTRFTVYLPALATERQITVQKQDPVRWSGKGECVLVIDDESSFRDITRSILERYNYRVLTASEGSGALALVAQHRGEIALAITDMMMPEMDGATTLKALHKLDPDLRLIATSGMSPPERFQPLEDEMPVPFLLKPYATAKLLQTVHDTLAGTQARKTLAP